MQDVPERRGQIKAPMRWFRMYAEFATDPKVQMLSEADQRRFMMLLCLRCSNGDVTLQDAECAFQLRISDAEYADTKARLVARGLIDEANRPTAWERRQYVSDTSNARVSRHRANKRKGSVRACNVTVTPPETETDTEVEGEKNTELAAQSEQEPARATLGSAAPPMNFDELEAKLVAACNGSLDNPVNCQGLLNLSVPQMWLQQGYDLETEIIPTLRAAGKKHHGKRIRDWSYFTPIIAENRAKRAKVAKPEPPVDRSNMEFLPPMYGKPGRWVPKREVAQ